VPACKNGPNTELPPPIGETHIHIEIGKSNVVYSICEMYMSWDSFLGSFDGTAGASEKPRLAVLRKPDPYKRVIEERVPASPNW
jgi:hypothetical protein